jgi:DNA (cytosine-5)-methyltransferase 1
LGGTGDWHSEPAVRRVADGISANVDRVAALGNAVVPQIPELIGNAILASLNAERIAA